MKLIINKITILILATLFFSSVYSQTPIAAWEEDFSADRVVKGEQVLDHWRKAGGIPFVPKTQFYLRNIVLDNQKNSVLVVHSKKSSAVFAIDLSKKINLQKTPIMRWRWRVKKLPPKADGRSKKLDEQAIGIYIGTGNPFQQKTIAYRWETETPLNHWGKVQYSGVMSVWFYCLRNKSNELNVWYEEERNVGEDFFKKYGFIPKKVGLAICGNSQKSKSNALAEIDYIGFFPKDIKKEINKE